ncbi:MAG: SDR family oxidoreductase [Saprospiraceae bacterium]
MGAALCKELSALGAHLILSARDMRALEELKTHLERPEKCTVLPLDVTNGLQINQATQQVLAQFGRIDILINNAGISQRSSSLDTALEIDRKIMEVNYFGTVHLTKNIAPSMLQNGSGHIVVISSVTGKLGAPMRSGYAASKHALHGFFDSFRAETEDKGIKTTIICPGYVHTNISINALTADGSPQNKMDTQTSNGMTPESLAKNILKAVSNGKREVYFGGKEILGIYIKRFIPSIYYTLVKKHNTN